MSDNTKIINKVFEKYTFKERIDVGSFEEPPILP